MKNKSLEQVLPRIRLKGTNDVGLTRYEWESIHMALRIILKVLNPEFNLPIDEPTPPGEEQ